MCNSHSIAACFRRRVIRLAAALTCVFSLTGCLLPPEVTIASYVVQAAIKTGMRYAEENKPTPEQAWKQEQIDRLHEVADSGNRDAQFRLGLLYQHRGDDQSEEWMCRAAQSGHVKAQVQVAHWFNQDRLKEDHWPFLSITPNDQTAYVWYGIAARQGSVGAEIFQAQVAARSLDEETKSQSNHLIERWTPNRGCVPRARSAILAQTPTTTSHDD